MSWDSGYRAFPLSTTDSGITGAAICIFVDAAGQRLQGRAVPDEDAVATIVAALNRSLGTCIGISRAHS